MSQKERIEASCDQPQIVYTILKVKNIGIFMRALTWNFLNDDFSTNHKRTWVLVFNTNEERINQSITYQSSCNQQKLTVVLLEDSLGSHSTDGNLEALLEKVIAGEFCCPKRKCTAIQELKATKSQETSAGIKD